MTSFLLVKILDGEDEDIVIVPSFWLIGKECHLPQTGLEAKAERQEMFKASWNLCEVLILSNHSNIFKFDMLCRMLHTKFNHDLCFRNVRWCPGEAF